MKILIVLTSHEQLGETGKKTGFWLEEFAAPYYLLKDAKVEITLASPQGGQPPLDPKSEQADAQTEATKRFKQDPTAQAQLANTIKLTEVSADDYDAVFYPGGHGPLWDLTHDENSINLGWFKSGLHRNRDCWLENRKLNTGYLENQKYS